MTLFEKIKRIDSKFSWSFTGLVFSFLFFLFGLYTTFLYEKKPKLLFQILSEAPVYSLKEEVSELDILFKGENIRKKNQTLTLLTLRVVNSGNADILKNSFDAENLPIIGIDGCNVIKMDVIGGSSDYLRSAPKFTVTNENHYLMSPVIIEPGEFFDLKFLLLHDEGTKPSLSVKGHIADVSKLEMVSLYAEKEDLTFWKRVFGGNILIQSLRVLAYAFGTLFVLASVILLSAAAFDKIETQRRRRCVAKFKLGIGLKFSEQDEYVFSEYINQGELFLLRLSHLFSNEQLLSQIMLDLEKNPIQPDTELAPFIVHNSPAQLRQLHDYNVVAFLVQKKLIQNISGKCEIPLDVKQNVQQFLFSLSVLSPKQIRAARDVHGSYGTESKPVNNLDSLTATEAVKK